MPIPSVCQTFFTSFKIFWQCSKVRLTYLSIVKNVWQHSKNIERRQKDLIVVKKNRIGRATMAEGRHGWRPPWLKALKAWALPRFCVPIHSYKKQLNKKFGLEYYTLPSSNLLWGPWIRHKDTYNINDLSTVPSLFLPSWSKGLLLEIPLRNAPHNSPPPSFLNYRNKEGYFLSCEPPTEYTS